MALTLAQYEDLFQLVSGYFYWRKNGLPNRVCDSLYSYVYSRDGIVLVINQSVVPMDWSLHPKI